MDQRVLPRQSKFIADADSSPLSQHGSTSGKPKWHDISFKRATRREDCYAHQRHLERCVAGQSTVGRTNQYLTLIFNILGVRKPRRRW